MILVSANAADSFLSDESIVTTIYAFSAFMSSACRRTVAETAFIPGFKVVIFLLRGKPILGFPRYTTKNSTFFKSIPEDRIVRTPPILQCCGSVSRKTSAGDPCGSSDISTTCSVTNALFSNKIHFEMCQRAASRRAHEASRWEILLGVRRTVKGEICGCPEKLHRPAISQECCCAPQDTQKSPGCGVPRCSLTWLLSLLLL